MPIYHCDVADLYLHNIYIPANVIIPPPDVYITVCPVLGENVTEVITVPDVIVPPKVMIISCPSTGFAIIVIIATDLLAYLL